MSVDAVRLRATQWLVIATSLWGLSFPAMKALGMAQDELLPGRGSFFLAALCVVYRFGAAAIFMALFTARTLGSITRDELLHGLGIGIFGGLGILFQMDGLARTEASTSAFLTQCYCLIIPLWVAARERRWPAWNVLAGCAVVVIGIGVLAKVDMRMFRLGRGELETILASVIFTGQILWLEHPRFANCRVAHSTVVQFAAMSLSGLPVALATTHEAGDWLRAYSTAPTLGLLAVLLVFCTFGGYVLMNQWQRHVGATLAGLIYCMEPVFASAFARFLPAWFGAWAGVNYPNETLTRELLIGGGLVFVANVLAQWRGASTPPPSRGE
jgi:drug/metabolite transporter (DMT)-like permease